MVAFALWLDVSPVICALAVYWHGSLICNTAMQLSVPLSTPSYLILTLNVSFGFNTQGNCGIVSLSMNGGSIPVIGSSVYGCCSVLTKMSSFVRLPPNAIVPLSKSSAFSILTFVLFANSFISLTIPQGFEKIESTRFHATVCRCGIGRKRNAVGHFAVCSYGCAFRQVCCEIAGYDEIVKLPSEPLQ